jgi:hypothetical protein
VTTLALTAPTSSIALAPQQINVTLISGSHTVIQNSVAKMLILQAPTLAPSLTLLSGRPAQIAFNAWGLTINLNSAL